MGAALFFGGVRVGAYSQEISETAFELVKLTLISTSPLIICYAMIQSLADPKLKISDELKYRAVVVSNSRLCLLPPSWPAWSGPSHDSGWTKIYIYIYIHIFQVP